MVVQLNPDEMISRTFSPAYPSVAMDSFYSQAQPSIAEFVMDGVAVERRPIPQQPQAFPFVSHQQPLSRAYQEPYRPLQYQSNQQLYKYNTPANAEACRTPFVEFDKDSDSIVANIVSVWKTSKSPHQVVFQQLRPFWTPAAPLFQKSTGNGSLL